MSGSLPTPERTPRRAAEGLKMADPAATIMVFFEPAGERTARLPQRR
jgi:hypothetical protein